MGNLKMPKCRRRHHTRTKNIFISGIKCIFHIIILDNDSKRSRNV